MKLHTYMFSRNAFEFKTYFDLNDYYVIMSPLSVKNVLITTCGRCNSKYNIYEVSL